MATTIAFEDEILKLLFNADPIDKLADNAAVTPAAQFYVSLHTQDPTKSGLPTQSSGELNYTGYARQVVPRTTAGWNVAGGKVTTKEIIEFPAPTDLTGPLQATFFGVGADLAGGGVLMFAGALKPAINLVNNVEPRIDNQSPASRFDETWA